MAIIEQTAGLLENLIIGSTGDRPIPNEQLQRIADRIGNQTKRGATIIRQLNAFAHSVDHEQRDLDLNDLTENAIALAHRTADRKRIQLEIRQSDDRPLVSNNPFRVQQALYLSLQCAASITPEGSKVTVSPGTGDSLAWMSVEGLALDSATASDLSYLEMLMDQIGGTMECKVGGGQIHIRLIFPAHTGEQWPAAARCR